MLTKNSCVRGKTFLCEEIHETIFSKILLIGAVDFYPHYNVSFHDYSSVLPTYFNLRGKKFFFRILFFPFSYHRDKQVNVGSW